ncbi:MAG: molybdopterin-binding protein [Nitrospirota bacterium]
MCDTLRDGVKSRAGVRTVPVTEAVGMVLAHDITEIRSSEFKGRAFKKGHVVREEDIPRLRRLGKDNLFVMQIVGDEMHEDDAAQALAQALTGEGVVLAGAPKEGRINIIAARDGLLKVDKETLARFNMLGEVMCATLHSNTLVKKGQVVAGTRAIPLVMKKMVIEEAVAIAKDSAEAVISVKSIRAPKAGIVITGNEVYYGRIQDSFAPVISRKIKECNGEIVGVYYAPDDEQVIESRIRELLAAGADLLILTGGMSVDPDDVTRFAIQRLGAVDITYGSAVLPGAMFLAAYFDARIPIIGIPACGMYHKTTVFDLVLPRLLAGERIGRKELAELGHGGLCLNCTECRFPVCPFGKC